VQVTGQEAINASGTLTPTVAPALRTLVVVTAEQVARVEAEARNADVDRLSLILSRLMAARSSAVETQPVVNAARRLASTSADSLIAGRARLLAERAQQYQGVSRRRDGDVVLQSQNVMAVPPRAAAATVQLPQSSVSQVGYLVQVYSARTNSPPFALTDHSGRTLAYVTPSPGVNIRMHLNSHITVTGQQGFLRGLNTPHILARRASRTPE
jgi:hypothetical protein